MWVKFGEGILLYMMGLEKGLSGNPNNRLTIPSQPTEESIHAMGCPDEMNSVAWNNHVLT